MEELQLRVPLNFVRIGLLDQLVCKGNVSVLPN